MSIYLGSNKINELYLGSEKIGSIYLGSQKVYSSAPVILDEVTIGTQTWKTKNLDFSDGKSGIYTQTVNYGQGEVVEYYYTWDAAVRVATSISGWHLPTKAELETLIETAGGQWVAGGKLKATYGWNNDGNGTDDYGFEALPAGYGFSGSFGGFGNNIYLWSATQAKSTTAHFLQLSVDPNIQWATGSKSIGCLVRLIKDSE